MRNFKLKLLALLFAILFWIFVVSTENTFYTFPSNDSAGIPIKAFNLSENLTLTQELGKVRVTIRTTSDMYQKLSEADFEAYIDFSGREAGKYVSDIAVTSKKPEVTVLKVEPSQIETTLESVTSKTVNIVSELVGKPAPNYEVSEVKLEITTMKIFGPESVLTSLNELKAGIELNGSEQEDFEKTFTVKALDGTGKELDTIRMEQNDVKAAVTINEVLESKTVGVRANITGTEGKVWIQKVIVDPATVLIKSEGKKLEKLEYLETEEINAGNLRQTVEKKVRLILPKGILLVNEKDALVKVTLFLGEYKVKKEISATVIFVGSNKDGDLQAEPSIIQVVVEGSESDIENLKSTDIYVTINLKGKKNGQILDLTPANFTIPENLTLIEFSPNIITLVR